MLLRSIFLAVLLTVAVHAGIVKDTVTYTYGATAMRGVVWYDDARTGKLPVVLIVHEWWGCNGYAQSRAEQMAGLGYLAFAVDMYGNGTVVTTPAEAGKLAGEVKGNIPLLRGRITAALDYIKTHARADVQRIGAMGYCFGGTVALELARSGADVKGVVSFHGALQPKNPADAKNITAKILVCHGSVDPYVPDAEVNAFRAEMEAYHVDYQLIMYSGAVHTFTNPNSGNKPETGSAYNERADKRSFAAMLDFFDEVLK